MLALCGKNPSGNVLHLVVGPETELFTDIHGAKILDITPVLRQMNFDRRVFISMTRCRSEASSAALMRSSGIEFLSSFYEVAEGEGQPANASVNTSDAANASAVPNAAPTPKPMTPTIECDYCRIKKQLLNVPGFKICTECAQIELGLGRVPDTENTADDISKADKPV